MKKGRCDFCFDKNYGEDKNHHASIYQTMKRPQKWLFLLHALPGRSKLVPPTLNLIFGLQIISFCFNVKKKNKMDKLCIIFNRPILRMGRLLRMGRAYKWILECLSVRHYFEDDQSTARRLHKPL